MSNFMPDDIKEAADKMGTDFIKGSEFEGEGLVLQIAKPIEKIVAPNPKYGANEKNYLVKQEVLQIGQTFRYVFATSEGQERSIETTSAPLFIAFNQLKDEIGELGIGDWVKIVREGKTTETRFTVQKVKAPNAVKPVAKGIASANAYPYPEADDTNNADAF